jgi:TolB protein
MACNPFRLSTLSLLPAVMLAMAPVVAQAESPGWWKKLFTKSTKVSEKDAVLTIAVSELEGSTGGTVAKALRGQLDQVEEVKHVENVDAARFVLSGKSVGGRISAVLKEREQGVLFERSYSAPGILENVRMLADDVVFVMTGRLGLTTSQLVFVSETGGKKQVYMVDADGKNLEQLTREPGGAVSPALAPDGSQLVFTSYAGGLPVLKLLDMAQGAERVAANAPGCTSGAAFSPDGGQLAVSMSFLGNPEIFVLELGTGHAICLTETTGVPCCPSWHPDGQRLIFAAQEGADPQLYIAEKQSAASARRWTTGLAFHADPEWSPEGTKVAFTTRSDGGLAVAVKGFAPETPVEIIRKGGAQHPTWSPDGMSLAYAQGGQLWVQDLKTGKRKSIVSGRGTISEPRWVR